MEEGLRQGLGQDPPVSCGGPVWGTQRPGRCLAQRTGNVGDKPSSRAGRDAKRKSGQTGHMRTADGPLPTQRP